ncbi:hypothetical protein C0J52_22145 [Blattella germanica]|nr:hypothetical protein C0J52_22145 [Blattella germanica]
MCMGYSKIKAMDRNKSIWNNSYVSCIRINGKPILPPLMTEERRKEMVHYRELAMTVEARLQRFKTQNIRKRSSVDSGITLSSSEQQEVHGNQNEKPNDTTVLPRTDTSIKSVEAYSENVVQCEETEEESNSNQNQVVEEVYCVKTDDTVTQNDSQSYIPSNLGNIDSDARNKYTDILSGNYTGYRPWGNISKSEKDSKLQNVCHSVKRTNGTTWNAPPQSTVINEPKGNIRQKWVKNNENTYLSDNTYVLSNKTACERDQELLPCSESSELGILSCNNFGFESAKQLSRTEHELSSSYVVHQEKPSCESSFMDEGKFVKMCEGVTNISESLRLECFVNNPCSKLNESSKTQGNKTNSSAFSSPDNSGLGSSNVTNSMLQVIGNINIENIDDSVSSIALTSSTDLNQYMNNTGSSGSFSPGQDLPASNLSERSSEPLKRSAATTFITRDNPVGQVVRLLSSSDSDLIMNYMKDQNERQKYLQKSKTIAETNFRSTDGSCAVTTDCNLRGGPSVLQKSSPDVSEPSLCNKMESFVHDFDKIYQIKDDLKCLTVPNAKLQTNKTPTMDNENNKSSNIPVYKYPHSPSHSRRKSLEDSEKVESTTPRLVRQNSYTLDSPSPLLIAHLETQKGKKCSSDMTESATVSSDLTKMSSDLSQRKDKNNLGTKHEVYPSPGNKTKVRKKSAIPPGSPLKHKQTFRNREHQNISLPSSPVKLHSPFMSLDCLPSAVSKEPTKLVHKISAPSKQRDALKVCSPNTSKDAKSTKPARMDSPMKNVRRKFSLDNTLKKQDDEQKGESQNNTESPQISQYNLHNMVVRLQTEHSQQMTELLHKQRKEQEDMHNAFLQQQNNLMLEMYNICPALFSKLESDSILKFERSSSTLTNEQGSLQVVSPLGEDTLVINKSSPSISRNSAIFSDTSLNLYSSQSPEKPDLVVNSVRRDISKHSINTSSCETFDAVNGNKTSEDTMSIPYSPKSNGNHITNKSSELDMDQNQILMETENKNTYPLVLSQPKSHEIKIDIPEVIQQPQREVPSVSCSNTEIMEHYFRIPCNRQLFPIQARESIGPDDKIEREKDIILTIRDTLLCAVQMNQDCWPDITPEDVALHKRLIHQVTAACYALHDVFFGLPIPEKMAIISADRERIRNHSARPPIPRPLSAATRRALERKILQ